MVSGQTGQPVAQGAPLSVHEGKEGSASVAEAFVALAGKQGNGRAASLSGRMSHGNAGTRSQGLG